MHTIEDMLVEKNYHKCPLKKRPVNYQFNDPVEHAQSSPENKEKLANEQPENLSLKKDIILNTTTIATTNPTGDNSSHTSEDINVSDCCEDEGVDVDHRTTDDEDNEDIDEDIDCDEDEDDEMIDCVDIDVADDDGNSTTTTQAAALVAAAAAASAATAAAAAAASLVVPTPTYPKYGIQPWNFHMSPYTAEFYRTINNPHLAAAATQISPLRGDLLSPSSPSDSVGSLSPPPPHYMHHGRASSVSPPMRAEIIHRPIGVRHQMPPQSPSSSHRFMPYPALPPAYAQHPHHHHLHPHHPQTTTPTYPPLSYHPGTHSALAPPHHHHHHHHAPISPAYSDSSYYSMRSLTPESNCSSLPEDLSVKQQQPVISVKSKSTLLAADAQRNPMDSSSNSVIKMCSTTSPSSAGNGSSSSSNSSCKKEKTSPPRYQCPDCQKSYSTFSGLTKHQQFHCPAAEGNQVKKSFSCKDCDKTYVSLGALKMHIRTHTLPCKCNICGKAFSRPWLLQGHIRTHTGEKPFSCQHCHRAFADRSNLRAHLQTHSDIKKYSCTNCSKTFSRMSLLTKHSEGGCPGGNSSSPTGSVGSPNSMSGYNAMYADH